MVAESDINQLIKRGPAGPDFEQSTIAYCDESVAIALTRLGEVLARQYPQITTESQQRLQELSQKTYHPLPSSDLMQENGVTYLQTHSGKRILANQIVESVYHANPRLGLFEYAICLYPTKNERYAAQRLPWFESRFSKIRKTADLHPNAPLAEIIACGYITQIAKNHATDNARGLLKRAVVFAGVSDPAKLSNYLDLVASQVSKVRFNEAFIAEGLSTIERLRLAERLDEKQIQVLFDLAFIRNKAFDQESEFRQALEPIIRVVFTERWDDAYLHRDFLLKYFVSSFPAWRGRRFQQESGITSFENFRHLAKSVREGKVVIHDDEVPEEYKKSFGDIFPKKVERARRERNLEIVQSSINLSNTVVRELAREWKISQSVRSPGEQIKLIFQNHQDLLYKLLTDGEDDFDHFMELIEEVDPDLTFSKAKSLYQELVRLKELYTDNKPPYVIREQKRTTPVLSVELDDSRQIFWYPTEQPVDIYLRGEHNVMSKNYGNFGRLLHNVILASFQENPERPVLNQDQLKASLNRAYNLERKRNPKIEEFTMSEYLLALINTVPFTFKPTEDDPVIQFVKSLSPS